MTTTLYQKIGGQQNLTRIVAQFYQHILADDRINQFFLENVSDIVKLHTTMELFLCHLFGGPNEYKGPDMISLHKNMKINKHHFQASNKNKALEFYVLVFVKTLYV